MAKNKSLSDQLIYLVFKPTYGQYHRDENGDWKPLNEPALGWGAVHNPGNEKYEEKVPRMLEWAYAQYHHQTYKVEDDIVYIGDRDWQPGQTEAVWKDWKAAPVQPILLKNLPVQGFKIANFVSRSRTANKVWRILDPRGFQLEISTTNMEDIIQNGVISHGQIMGPYQWDFGKNGIGKAHLVPFVE